MNNLNSLLNYVEIPKELFFAKNKNYILTAKKSLKGEEVNFQFKKLTYKDISSSENFLSIHSLTDKSILDLLIRLFYPYEGPKITESLSYPTVFKETKFQIDSVDSFVSGDKILPLDQNILCHFIKTTKRF